MYKNYEVLYMGQGSPDRLTTLSLSEELFERYKNEDDQIIIGGGYNGQYYLVPAEVFNEGKFIGLDETVNEDGINNLQEMVSTIQECMTWDGGSYISSQFIEGLEQTEREEVKKRLRYRILQYSGQDQQ